MNPEVFRDYTAYYNLLYRDKDYGAEVDYVESLVHKVRSEVKRCRVLDVGCGTGRHAAALAARGHSVVGVDASEEMIRLARQSASDSTVFVVADARTLNLDEHFPVAVSLFHVASYQTSTQDLLAFFHSIGEHLERNGILVFDAWYGPAVLYLRPEVRVREIEDEELRILRIARPTLKPEENCVLIDYDLLVERKSDGSLHRFNETHRMRYLFLPEIRDLLDRTGFELLLSEEWMTSQPLGLSTWSACLVAAKKV
jgi:SAM-dependent methyltransferase